jgi:hypothetical protein
VTLEAFCDDLNEYSWFITLDNRLKAARFERIGQRGSNPSVIDDLIIYDRPDVILLNNGKPVLVIEKTREVPTGHNVGQRVARLVRALELGIPTIKFFPFDARKHGAHTGVCNLNARLLLSFENMWNIHETPIAAINWPSDSHGELIEDESADAQLSRLISGYLDSDFDRDCAEFEGARELQLGEYSTRCAAYVPYAKPPPSLRIDSTSTILRELGVSLKSDNAIQLLSRKESVLYEIGMNEDKCRREDPYTGTQFIYDYLYCRNGPTTEDKFRNLILYFPKIREDVWKSENPDDPSRKSSNWYLTANAHVFSDGWSLLR